MNINLKKGKASDISLVLGKHFQENTETHEKLFEMVLANDLSYSYTDKIADEYSIQLHLSNATKADEKAKKAETTASKKKERENTDINLLLSKYCFQPGQKAGLNSKNKPKTQLSSDYNLKLYLLYVNSSNVHDIMNYFERLKKDTKPEVKYIFLLEGIQDYISGKEMKNKKQKKDFMLSQQTGSQNPIQMKFAKSGNMCIEEEAACSIETREQLEEFLVTLSIESQLDYKMTSNTKESVEFIKNCIGSVIHSKYKSNLGYFDVKGHSHTAVSIYSGKNFFWFFY